MTWKKVRSGLTVGFVSWTLALACSTPNASDTKTNWMMACEQDVECGTDLSCVCGVCTQICETDSQCRSFGSDTLCTDPNSCGEAGGICSPRPSGVGGDEAGGTGGTSGDGGGDTGGAFTGGASSGGNGSDTGGVPELGGAGPEAGGSDGSGGDSVGGSGGSPSECGCVSAPLTWGRDGGLVAYKETSTLHECDTYEFLRTPTQTDPPSEFCSQTIEECDSSQGPADVQEALEHPDVQAALAAAPVLYGADTRPVDGQVFVFEVGGAVVEVGGQCDICTAIPEGVTTLVELLEQVTAEQLALPPCNAL